MSKRPAFLRVLKPGTFRVPGFLFSGIHCGVKKRAKDLAVIFSETKASAAGTFTTNRLKSESVQYTQNILKAKSLQAIIVGSGNANCCNGKQGLADAEHIGKTTASCLGISPKEIAVLHTGVIGVPLPMKKFVPGIIEAARQLDVNGMDSAAQAVLTTDTKLKRIGLRFTLSGKTVTLAGMAKGAGMICPNMATMFAFFFTDAKVETNALAACLRSAVAQSFNRITVDGDQSPSDTVLVMANGFAKNTRVPAGSKELIKFQKALNFAALFLARQIVMDGEGATKFIEICVRGAKTENQALNVAKRVANSTLVKTAVFGEDPNWGRILNAVGYSGENINPGKVSVSIGKIKVCHKGVGIHRVELLAHRELQKKEVQITLDLNNGSAEGSVFTSDLSYDYVRINAEYRT